MSTRMSIGYGPHFHVWVDGTDGTVALETRIALPAADAAVDCVEQDGEALLRWESPDEPERIAAALMEAAKIMREMRATTQPIG